MLASVAVLLSGCAGLDLGDPFGAIGRVAGGGGAAETTIPYAAIVAEEPSVVLVGQNIVAAGGNAADAAVAIGFALAVTLPSRAGLGGGGACLVRDAEGTVSALDFMPVASRGAAGARRPTALPTLVRGLAALHLRYGRLAWAALVAPAEDLARDGITVTAPLAEDLAAASRRLAADPVARTLFIGSGGAPLAKGDVLEQLDLRAVLAQIRTRGAGEFYSGLLAHRLVAAVEAVGGALNIEDLRRYLPRWRDPAAVSLGADTVLAQPSPAAGFVAANMLLMAAGGERYARASPVVRGHLMAEIAKRALRDGAAGVAAPRRGTAPADSLSARRAAALMRDYRSDRASRFGRGIAVRSAESQAETGFVVVDGNGLAVACTLSMSRPFGIGRMVPGLGVLMAPAPRSGTGAAPGGGALMVLRGSDRALRLALFATGGGPAGPVLAQVAARVLMGGDSLEQAIRAPRVHYRSAGDRVLVERSAEAPLVEGLVLRGHRVERVPALGRVGGVYCPRGVPAGRKVPDCVAARDSRGNGLAAIVRIEE